MFLIQKRIFAALIMLLAGTGLAAAAESSSRTFYMGFQDFAYDKTDKGEADTYAFLRENADIVCLQFGADCPWQQAYDGAPFPVELREKMERRLAGVGPDKNIYLEISPLDMGRAAMGGTNMDRFKDKPFDDPAVKKAYLTYARRMAEFFNPKFLCIGIEVNELAGNSPEKWPGYVELHRHVYQALKKEHPDLPVFASMTLHNLLAVRNSGNGERLDRLQDFLPYNDVAGISFYPFLGDHRDPSNPTKNFDWIREFTGEMPMAISETAYPAETINFSDRVIPASPESQVDYLQTVFNMAMRDGYLFVINFAYRDYDAWWEKDKDKWPEWVKAWKDTGVVDGNGEPRISYTLWKDWLARPYNAPPALPVPRDEVRKDAARKDAGLADAAAPALWERVHTYGILPMAPAEAARKGWTVNGLWTGFGMSEAVRGTRQLLSPPDVYPPEWAYPTMKDYVDACHEAGTLAPATLFGIGDHLLLRKRFPEIELCACRYADGSTAYYEAGSRLFMCSNDPLYEDVMLQLGEEAIDAGADLIVFDELQGNELTLYWPNSTGYCDDCLRAYREHLGTKYSEQELAEKFGIEDLASFDFVKRLGPQGGKPWAETDSLFKELWTLQKRNSFERGKRVVEGLRAYMKEAGRSIPVCGNTTEMGLQQFTGIRLSAVQWGSVLDFAAFENSRKDLLPRGKWVAAEKLAVATYEMPPAVLIRYDPLHKMELEYLEGKSNRSVYLYGLLAEAYANGVGFVNYHQEKGLPQAAGLWNDVFEAQRFVLKNAELFDPNATTGANVAVLYIENEGQRYRGASYLGLTQALAESNIPFDVIVDGGDGFVPVKLTVEDLMPYGLVVLPQALGLAPAQMQALERFVKNGGKVLTADPAGAGFDLLPQVEMPDGSRKDAGAAYFAGYDEAVRRQIAQAVSARAELPLEISGAGRDVCAYPRYDAAGERLVIHLINSDYDTAANVMRSKQNIRLRVKRPAWYKEGRPATVYSPDFEDGAIVNCPAATLGEFVEITVPKLDVYSLVVL